MGAWLSVAAQTCLFVAVLATPAHAMCRWFLETTYDFEVLACQPGGETARAKAEAVLERYGGPYGLDDESVWLEEDYVERATQRAGFIVTVRTLALVYKAVPPGIELRYRAEREIASEFEMVLLEHDFARGCLELEPGVELRLADTGVCCDTLPATGVCLVGLPVFRPSGVRGDS
jgi:hypothetical protein